MAFGSFCHTLMIKELVGLDSIMYVVQDEIGQLDSATIIVELTTAAGPVLPIWLPARFLNEDQSWTAAISYFFDWVEDRDLDPGKACLLMLDEGATRHERLEFLLEAARVGSPSVRAWATTTLAGMAATSGGRFQPCL